MSKRKIGCLRVLAMVAGGACALVVALALVLANPHAEFERMLVSLEEQGA